MSAVVLLWAMVLGIVTGIGQPSASAARLIAGVMLFLFRLYERAVLAAGAKALAKLQGWLHIMGGILLPIGVAALVTHRPGLIAIAVMGSLIVVFRTVRRHIFRPIRGIVRGTDSPILGPRNL